MNKVDEFLLDDEEILVPCQNAAGEIVGICGIDDVPQPGTFYVVGKKGLGVDQQEIQNLPVFVMTANYETGVIMNRSTGLPVLVAGDDENLLRVSEMLNDVYPTKKCLIATDDKYINNIYPENVTLMRSLSPTWGDCYTEYGEQGVRFDLANYIEESLGNKYSEEFLFLTHSRGYENLQAEMIAGLMSPPVDKSRSRAHNNDIDHEISI